MIKRIETIFQSEEVGGTLTVQGWVRTRRDTGAFSFIEVNDGSCLANLQIIAEQSLPNYEEQVKKLTAGCAVKVTGRLEESPAKGQAVELHASEVVVVGWADPEEYPLQKKRHSFEFLREICHLRPRTNALGAAARVRSRLSYGIHHFFQERGFYQVHTPVITTSDCEGAGEMFTVTTAEHQESDNKDQANQEFFGSSRLRCMRWRLAMCTLSVPPSGRKTLIPAGIYLNFG